MLLVIDNYDSFTYNIVQYLGEMQVDLQVHRNDQISIETFLRTKRKTRIVRCHQPNFKKFFKIVRPLSVKMLSG